MTDRSLRMRASLIAAVLASTFALAGCERNVELLSRLGETDANAGLKVLRQHGIAAAKTYRKDGIVLEVSSADTVAALSALNAYGLPRGSSTSMGDVFKREGMVSTPLEERARYVHALSKELESIIEEIDGVVVARVLVVLPERGMPGSPAQMPSASVFVKHRDEFEPELIRPQIARMVGAAVPGLADGWREHVTVVFVQASEIADRRGWVNPAGGTTRVGGGLIWISAGVVVALVGAALFVGWRTLDRRRRASEPESVVQGATP